MGTNTDERQIFLNDACTAWNIAVLPEHLREKTFLHNLEEFKRLNPGASNAEKFDQNMRVLVKKKLQMFPNVKKIIVNAFIEPISETQYQINVASSDNL